MCLQTYAYGLALKSQEPEHQGEVTSHYGVFLKADGTYRLVNCKDYKTKYGIDTENAWADLLGTHHLVNYLLATKERK